MPHKLAKVYVRLNEVIFLPNHFTKLTFKRKWPSANAMWLFPVPFKKQSPEHIWRALREFERMMHEYACWKALWRRDLVLVPISSVWLGLCSHCTEIWWDFSKSDLFVETVWSISSMSSIDTRLSHRTTEKTGNLDSVMTSYHDAQVTRHVREHKGEAFKALGHMPNPLTHSLIIILK